MKSLKALFAVICLVCAFFPSSVFAESNPSNTTNKPYDIQERERELYKFIDSSRYILSFSSKDNSHLWSISAMISWRRRDYPEAFRLAEKAEAANDDACFALLGLFYYRGYGVDTDREKAVEYFKKGTTANRLFVPLCYYYLSVYYGRHEGGTLKSPQLAFSYAKKCVDSAELLSAELLSEGEFAVEVSDVFLYNLGRMYFHGVGTEKCPEMAVKYLRRPAEAGFNNSRFLISISYALLGQKELAFLWVLAGAEQEKEGIDSLIDKDKKPNWWTLRFGFCTPLLARSYEEGFGCEKNLLRSRMLFMQLEKTGHGATADDVARVEKKIRELRKTKESTVEKK